MPSRRGRSTGRALRRQRAKPIHKATAVTVGDHVRGILGDSWDARAPAWPPDAFAAAASLLRRSDAYSFVVTTWAPRREWVDFINGVGKRWREAVIAGRTPPQECVKWWKVIVSAAARPLDQVRGRSSLCMALLQLVAAADQASMGAGILGNLSDMDQFDFRAAFNLRSEKGSSLCEVVHPSRAVVLPKMHTPRSGITIRSLTHNLALWEGGEVQASWRWLPWWTRGWGLNILLVPLPDTVEPKSFRTADSPLTDLPPEFAFFTADLSTPSVIHRVKQAIRNAERLVGRVDAIVFPELVLRPAQADRLCRQLGRLIVGGIGEVARSERPGSNAAFVAAPLADAVIGWTQAKHHRWRLDAGQINQYGIGGIFDPTMEWWENIAVKERQLTFLSVNSWLTMCVLICEDLARQDPVADLVRAVGPNLVVCLLQDGPQLSARWPARYATVLADDPGSSVLTLTSLGMARLCRPPGMSECRVIALWKDARSTRPVEIAMDDRSGGVVLSLTREFREEWSADGRGDGGTTAYLLLNGIHQVPS
jgi:hypothetical protein